MINTMAMEEETLPIIIVGFSIMMLLSFVIVISLFIKSHTIREKKAMGYFLGFLLLFSTSVLIALTVIGPPGKPSAVTSMRLAASGILWFFSMLSFLGGVLSTRQDSI
ncbi:hypothetical protein SAMN05518683_106112 [Salibacterium halotolerans]|uniref:Uncharacterized protein n=2 Tax=Salibacterium halotolerans TaxID=1884432 RepID=A0A1I5R187_9BACI|nr:hypothetical protein SAMN05518683_106112 [Salibacterium halotolerans]